MSTIVAALAVIVWLEAGFIVCLLTRKTGGERREHIEDDLPPDHPVKYRIDSFANHRRFREDSGAWHPSLFS
jgi:hypothetical protein